VKQDMGDMMLTEHFLLLFC